MNLYPTPTRLRLLDQIDAGLVSRDQLGEVWLTDGGTWKVTAQVRDMEHAGWVLDVGARIDLTSLGRKIQSSRSAA